MNHLTKQMCGACLGIATATLAFTADAADHVFNGTVKRIVVHNPALVAVNDWFSILGVTSATGCPTYTTDGHVVMKLPSRTTNEYKSMLAILQAAQLSSQTVTVTITTTLTDGFCTVKVLHSIGQ